MEKNISKAQINITMEIDGIVHLVAMEQERLDAVSMLIRSATETVIPTKKTQAELVKFLDYKR
ncbi:hypothetical protein [Jeotgalibacillus haloalkalitolerans]|uniref:Uncharacterized protein n=1 Tax=Jeotgalibacillus haloalkalitolerans TaxID=3104292 RepID=A0ABU5KK63_9BACL|nr:hypothetical protein [Jeotgalibacillus sp. HH7-29]MDZ5711638.1 hypothetical protein [Jeotgalibacillus sp. HH7-29]